jgi:hypothetical protein
MNQSVTKGIRARMPLSFICFLGFKTDLDQGSNLSRCLLCQSTHLFQIDGNNSRHRLHGQHFSTS